MTCHPIRRFAAALLTTTATVRIPAKEAASVAEAGKPTANAASLKSLRMDHGAAVYHAGSGSYAFTSQLAPAP
jgi:alpha-L-rhamnosidase